MVPGHTHNTDMHVYTQQTLYGFWFKWSLIKVLIPNLRHKTAYYNLSHAFLAMVPKCMPLDTYKFLISRSSFDWAMHIQALAFNLRKNLQES